MSVTLPQPMSRPALNTASWIELSMADPLLNEGALESKVALARCLGLASVALLPYHVSQAAAMLRGSQTRVAAIIGFPRGTQEGRAKLEWAERAVREGAREIVVVADYQKALSGDWKALEHDLKAIATYCRRARVASRAVLKARYLREEHLEQLCSIVGACGFTSAANSTGFAVLGLPEEDLKLMRQNLPGPTQLVAAGPLASSTRLADLLVLGCNLVSTPSLDALL